MEKKNEVAEYYSGRGEYSKSNLLIGSKYKSSLLENKLIAVSLSKINEAIEDKEGTLIVKIPATELKQLLGVSGNSFYERLDETAEAMTGRTIGMSDPETQSFDYIAVVDRAHYEGGILTVEYNRHLNKYLKNIESNFTILSIDTMMQFDSVYAFRLYEVLKSRCYTRKGAPKTNKYSINISLSELKLDLGIINANEDRVKRVLRGSTTPDYDEAARVAVEKMYSKWYEFKRQVLDVAVQEINSNEKAMMQIDYNTDKCGRGGRVVSVTFLITLLGSEDQREKKEETSGMSEDDEMEFLFELKTVFSEFPELKLANLKEIAKTANWDMKACKKAAIVASEAGDIENPTGFIISAIKNNWEKNNKNSNRKNSFNDFTQNEYDYEDLEKKLVAN